MSQPRRRSQQGGRRGGARRTGTGTGDLWRPVRDLPPPEPIAPAPDATALLRSLGDPPLHGHVASHYLAAVVERAAMVATALAASAGLLAGDDEEAGEA